MPKRIRINCALTVAGSDSGGGAGIQADLKTFAALGVHGTSTVTCLTAQNPSLIKQIEPASPRMVRDQLNTVFDAFRPKAAKLGMLCTREIIETVAQFFATHRQILVVLDPVIISTSGHPLLKPSAFTALKKRLFPLATILTPNLDEAATILGIPIREPEDLRQAARELWHRYKCSILVKGGHLQGMREAMDIFFNGVDELCLTAPYITGVKTHGTGCTYASAITAYLSMGRSMPEAVLSAKHYVTNAIAESKAIGRYQVLDWFWNKKRPPMMGHRALR